MSISIINNEVTIAPKKALILIIKPEVTPIAHDSVTASPAPELTPIIPGAAKLFARTLCSIAPETANAAPAAIQAIVLGSLE